MRIRLAIGAVSDNVVGIGLLTIRDKDLSSFPGRSLFVITFLFLYWNLNIMFEKDVYEIN